MARRGWHWTPQYTGHELRGPPLYIRYAIIISMTIRYIYILYALYTQDDLSIVNQAIYREVYEKLLNRFNSSTILHFPIRFAIFSIIKI
jgi:hypothetical protein